MAALFVGALLLGIVLGVIAMLRGVERPKPDVASGLGLPLAALFSRDAAISATRQISARYTLPLVGAYCIGLGAVGYAVHRLSSAGDIAQVVFGMFGGAITLAGAIILIAGWAVPSARRDVPDERYVLQGQFAVVTRGIEDPNPGEVAIDIDGVRHTIEARSLDGSRIAQGTEVVIERVEEAIAYVEPWSQVERRL
jgi:NfeD-like C-terminal, partner-binding